jgi:hypothetical protein
MAAHPFRMFAMPPVEVNRNEAPPPAPFGIPPHIHVCVLGTGAVILDVRRDKYLGIDREDSELLSNAVAGWPQPLWHRSTCRGAHGILQATNELCASLAADGILERIPEGQEARVVVALRDMRGEWISIGDELEVRGRARLRHVRNFLSAYAWARYSLARRPFAEVVEQIRARKLSRVRDMDRYQLRKIAAMVDVFGRLRPFVFAAEGRCLLHALTLIRFLSKYQLHPEWVIGVTTQPWGAHSWVQWDNYLLDSNPEKVCGYTPIMMV